jgi:hypothetical protein
MKYYKLLKDLPTFEAGDLFYISEYGALVYDDGGYGVMAYSQSELERFPNILTEWFEEIQEPTNSSNWKPKKGDQVFLLGGNGQIFSSSWVGANSDNKWLEFGNTYRTEEEAEKARDRRLAEVRLRRTSDFKPDWKNEKYGYSIFYGPRSKKLFVTIRTIDGGEIVRYATQEEAEKSIKEHEADWKKYFGIKEEK